MESEIEIGAPLTATWCSYTKDLLEELKLEEYWESNTALAEKEWKKLIRARIHEREEKQWLTIIASKPKLRTYRKVKQKLEQEPYLYVRDRKGIPELTKLRSGTNRLRIEKGRYDKLPVEKRLCRFCDADAVEDEKHFLLHCEEYEELRQKMWRGLEALFSYPVQMWPDEKKLGVLLGAEEYKKRSNYNEVIKCVVNYIKWAMAKRRIKDEKIEKSFKEIQVLEALRERMLRNRAYMRSSKRGKSGVGTTFWSQCALSAHPNSCKIT